MIETSVLLSIKPKYASLILKGEKDIELRRKCPKFNTDMKIYLYSTSPTCAIVGEVLVKNISWLTKDYLWRKYGSRTGVTLNEFKNYFNHNGHGCAIELSKPKIFAKPLELKKLKNEVPNFTPPQSYLFIQCESELNRAIESFTNEISN